MPKFAKSALSMAATIVGLLFFTGYVAQSVRGDSATAGAAETDSRGNALPSGVTDDATLLLSRCGKPTSDESTEYENPRPKIPLRIITYESAKVAAIFIPGWGAKVGELPPYRWSLKFVGEPDGDNPYKPLEMSEANRRLPCWPRR